MSTLIAIGAAIAVFTGIGAGIGIGHATGKNLMKMMEADNRKGRCKRCFS